MRFTCQLNITKCAVCHATCVSISVSRAFSTEKRGMCDDDREREGKQWRRISKKKSKRRQRIRYARLFSLTLAPLEAFEKTVSARRRQPNHFFPQQIVAAFAFLVTRAYVYIRALFFFTHARHVSSMRAGCTCVMDLKLSSIYVK